jgi:hypothetical protein
MVLAAKFPPLNLPITALAPSGRLILPLVRAAGGVGASLLHVADPAELPNPIFIPLVFPLDPGSALRKHELASSLLYCVLKVPKTVLSEVIGYVVGGVNFVEYAAPLFSRLGPI